VDSIYPFNPKMVIETFYRHVDEIVTIVLDDRAQNSHLSFNQYLSKFSEAADLSSCDERVQRLYRKMAQAVQKEVKHSLPYQPPEDSPFYIHFIFNPADSLLTQLDKEQPGGADFLLHLLKLID
jgi:hypothetical protein